MQTQVKIARDSRSRTVANRSYAGKQAGGSTVTFADNGLQRME